jgi:hypothetical protein
VSDADSALQAVSIPSAWDLDWEVRDVERDGNVPGPVRKVLRRDPAGGGLTYLLHLPPGWRDDVLDWHPTTEEAYILAGSVILADNVLDVGSALYRPPGILHGPVCVPTDAGASTLSRMSGDSRILRYDGDEFPHRHMQPITDDYKDWPVAWTEKLDTKQLAWEAVTVGGWAGTVVKRLHRNRVTGGGVVLLAIPSGWRGRGSRARGPLEEFVIEGELAAGGVAFGRWGYAYRPPGQPAGEYASEAGALLFCWWDEADELDEC